MVSGQLSACLGDANYKKVHSGGGCQDCCRVDLSAEQLGTRSGFRTTDPTGIEVAELVVHEVDRPEALVIRLSSPDGFEKRPECVTHLLGFHKWPTKKPRTGRGFFNR